MNTSRALAGFGAILALLAADQRPAEAALITFEITGGSFSLGTGWGGATPAPENTLTNWNLLNADWTVDGALAGTSFGLSAVGQTFTATFGSVYLGEEDSRICDGATNAGDCEGAATDETDNLDVAVFLGLSSPLVSTEEMGALASASVSQMSDAAADLSVTFDPVTVTYGDGNQFQVELLDAATLLPTIDFTNNAQTRTLVARFTLLAYSGPPLALSEPGTLALFAFGLAGLGLVLRRTRPSA